VASLSKYPLYEQQAWASSLPPSAMQMFRQITAANNARKQGLVLADPPSSGRVGGVGNGNGIPDRQAPPIPTIRYFDFAFSTNSGIASKGLKHAIRLYNLKGVVTHAVILGSETSEIELTAYIPSPTTEDGEKQDPPEVSLRVNGNPGSLAKWIYNDGEVEKDKGRPSGMRWNVGIPITRLETKLEVVATKPGALAETSVIFVNRQ